VDIESHLQTTAVYGGEMRENNITIEEIQKKQVPTELQSDPLRRQDLQQTLSVQ
jgi:acetyl-CoA acetyltransferase